MYLCSKHLSIALSQSLHLIIWPRISREWVFSKKLLRNIRCDYSIKLISCHSISMKLPGLYRNAIFALLTCCWGTEVKQSLLFVCFFYWWERFQGIVWELHNPLIYLGKYFKQLRIWTTCHKALSGIEGLLQLCCQGPFKENQNNRRYLGIN